MDANPPCDEFVWWRPGTPAKPSRLTPEEMLDFAMWLQRNFDRLLKESQ